MKNIPELDKIFDIEPQAPAENLPAIITDDKNLDQEDDYQLARTTLRNLIHKSENTLDDMIELAKNSEHPRTYEVAGQLIKTVSDVAKDLIELQKKVKDLKDGEPQSAKSVTNNNVVFAGSTADLFKMLKNKDDGKTIEQ
jgi:inactivated superfamily I helicase